LDGGGVFVDSEGGFTIDYDSVDDVSFGGLKEFILDVELTRCRFDL
jgi:hypothetical protein